MFDGGAWANYPRFVFADASFRAFHQLDAVPDTVRTVGFCAALRAALGPNIARGRRVRGSSVGQRSRATTSNREQTQRIREWAEANGYNPSARGRINQDIVKAYDEAH